MQFALRTLAPFAAFGIAWVLFSSRVVRRVADPYSVAVFEAYRGWIFLILSLFVVYVLVRGETVRRRRAELDLAGAFSANLDPMLIVRMDDARVLEVNEGFTARLGVSRSDATGRPLDEIDVWPDPGTARKLLADVRRSGAVCDLETELRTKEGSPKTVLISALAVEIGRDQHMVMAVKDITGRIAAEDALRASETRLSGILDIAYDAIISADESQRIIIFNKGAERIFGYSRDEVLGRSLGMLLPAGSAIGQRDFVQPFGDSGEAARFKAKRAEIRGRRKSGEEFPAETSIAGVDIAGERIFTAVLRDITARKASEAALRQKTRRLAVVNRLDRAISSSLDVGFVLEVLLDQIQSELGVDAAGILLLNPHTQVLELASWHDLPQRVVSSSTLRLGEDYPGRAARDQQILVVPNLRGFDESARCVALREEGFGSYVAVPLVAKGQVRGVLELVHRSEHEVDGGWLSFLETLAASASVAIDNARLFDDVQRSHAALIGAYDETLVGWVRALDLRDKETEGHTQRVTDATVRLARRMGIGEAELVHVRRGALLHDIGKIGVPDGILHKPGPLDEKELEIMRRHPVHAFEMLAPIGFLRPAVDIPYCHHEKWDGTGYPRGLKGETIPREARIFAVVDVWDALIFDRPYRAAWSRDRVLEHVKKESGFHFDPDVVEAFIELAEKGDLLSSERRAERAAPPTVTKT